LHSFRGEPGYAEIEADLEKRIKQMRVELKVPEKDDPEATGELALKRMEQRQAANKKANKEK